MATGLQMLDMPQREEPSLWASVNTSSMMRVPELLLHINKYIYREEKRITPTEMFVLLLLLSLIEEGAAASPSKSFLSRAAMLSPRQIQRTLASLEKKGYLEIISRYENKARASNIYDLSKLISVLKKASDNNYRIDIAA